MNSEISANTLLTNAINDNANFKKNKPIHRTHASWTHEHFALQNERMAAMSRKVRACKVLGWSLTKLVATWIIHFEKIFSQPLASSLKREYHINMTDKERWLAAYAAAAKYARNMPTHTEPSTDVFAQTYANKFMHPDHVAAAWEVFQAGRRVG